MKTKEKVNPKLTLVGAGPGDPELITVKGLNALQRADVVLYDALVNPELLKHVPLDVKKIYVGKRKGEHNYNQDQINSLIVEMAFTHGHVVRLKGGDPFVFGRGYEEIEHAEVFNIETNIIPGISSSIGVAGYNKIPVTHRNVSESFWVITGTTKENQLSNDLLAAAKTKATVVILMGLSKLNEIVEAYHSLKKDNEAIAVISNGTLNTQSIVIGTIDSIAKQTDEAKIKSPAVIIIGDVVKLHKDFPQTLINWKNLLNEEN